MPHRSPLALLVAARERGLPRVYLGYYVAGSDHRNTSVRSARTKCSGRMEHGWV